MEISRGSRTASSAAIRSNFLSLIPRMIVLHDQVAREEGLSSTELQVLHVASLASDSSSPTEISRRTGLPPSTVTRTLDGLERRGLIHRRPDATDQRRVVVTVDADASRPISERFDAYARAMRSADTEFTDDELAVIARYWTALSRSADAELDARS